ncbi:MAG: cyclase family protein [Bacteriovoracales bacterium]|nr:cyclase family protein [Bacteriovoracales bacterium]
MGKGGGKDFGGGGLPLDGYPLIDISPVIDENLAVWPGDKSFVREECLSFEKGDNLTLSSIHTTVHLGAHADAPLHYHPEGKGMAERGLHHYLGPCLVTRVSLPKGERIFPRHIKDDLKDDLAGAPRVLFKTGSFPDPGVFNEDFNALSWELVDFLAEKGVILVGLDTPSVDIFSDKVLEAHRAIHAHDMAILEGVNLEGVEPGLYQLIALPLPIRGGDASPVRAVLLDPRERP